MPEITVEVAYALPEKQYLFAFQVACGTDARSAVLQSPLPQLLPDLDFARLPIGIFGKAAADDTVLHEHDRVEIYRPLLIDPKENRRRRQKRRDTP